MTKAQIEKILQDSLHELFERDHELLRYNVSERAITHKLAEYLQSRIPSLNVDCEYNRNFENGPDASKSIYLLKEKTKDEIHRMVRDEDEELITISTFPDIIVHRRTTNENNLLVVEVKKTNSRVDHRHDYEKLQAFTESRKRHNPYHFSYGVFVLLETGENWNRNPELKWFVNGQNLNHDG